MVGGRSETWRQGRRDGAVLYARRRSSRSSGSSFGGVELGLWQALALAAEIRLRVQISRRAVAGISLADDPLKNPCNRPHALLSVPSQPSLKCDQTLIRLIDVLTC